MTAGTEAAESQSGKAKSGEAQSGEAQSEEKSASTESADGAVRSSDATGASATPEREESLGWRGWVLVAGVVVSFLVIPWVIVLLPRAQGFLASLGLGLRDAYLVLPMIPALGLGALAVWAAVADRRTG